jgi:hypothetical protein
MFCVYWEDKEGNSLCLNHLTLNVVAQCHTGAPACMLLIMMGEAGESEVSQYLNLPCRRMQT